MDFKTFTILTLIYLVPGYIFYFLFTAQIFLTSSKELSTPFFNLIKLLACIDLLFIPLHFWIYRIGHFENLWPFLESFNERNLLMTIIQWLFCVLQHSQFIVHLLLALNRICAVIIPHSYKIYWAPRHFWKYCIFTCLVPMIYMGWLLKYGAHMYYEEGYNYMVDSYSTGSTLVSYAFVISSAGDAPKIFGFRFFCLHRKPDLLGFRCSVCTEKPKTASTGH